jgi:hypothetical protein
MNNQGTPHTPSPWHLSTWSEYFDRFMHPAADAQKPEHVTRRQQLLAEQDRKRQERRAHVLELLQEVKDKHHPHPKGPMLP